MSKSKHKFWELRHPGALRGVLPEEPAFREQDATAEPVEHYAVVFFPKITGIGHADLRWPSVLETLSRTPDAAICKFLDRLVHGKKWETYHDAGHRVRRVLITDLGDAEQTP
jgi:hypothetical protein